MHHRIVLLASFLVAACTADNETKPPGATIAASTGIGDAASSSGLAVGSACKPEDGYVPKDPCAGQPSNKGPTNCLADGGAAEDFTTLPAGVGFCLRADEYPGGYFTMNCSSNRDCPGGSICDGRRCWMPCLSDGQCTSPATCSPLTASVKICRCNDCVPRGQPR